MKIRRIAIKNFRGIRELGDGTFFAAEPITVFCPRGCSAKQQHFL